MTLLEPEPCYALVLITNRYFGHWLVEHPELVRNAWAVMCTYGRTCMGLNARGVHNHTIIMGAPAVHPGVANTLPYVLKAVCDINGRSGCANFTRMHVTGVTFYDRGAEYTPGYMLRNESSRHNASANKAYVLAWVQSLGRRASIDYPGCLPADASSHRALVPSRTAQSAPWRAQRSEIALA